MRKKGLICIIALSLIVATVLGIFLFNKNTNTTSYDISCEIKRASSYNEITDDDYKVDNCEYVKFNAFFIRDLDGDGYAEKYDGTCNYIDKSPTLYFDINVLTDGSFQNGKITINGKNFNLSTTLVKDEVIKSDYISTNTTSILLNDINYGTQKLFSGNISANIGNNINNYSREDNTIVLTGTWVSTDGTQSVNINKTITLKTDWYGKTRTEVYPYITTSHDISTVIGTENVNLTFSVGYKETAKELLIQKQVTEVTIPDLNGYAPTEVTVTSQNCNYEYNEESKILTITRNAVVDDNGNITSSVSRENTYEINVTYPIAAQDGIDTNTISITFPTTGYYYGYNNSSDEFEDENPYISSISKAVTHTWKQPSGSIASVFVDVGKTVWNSDTHSYRQLISKKLPVNIYNNVEQENDEKDEYSVIWRASTGSTAISELKMEETNCDKFLKTDGTYIDMTDYIKTTGIYFTNISNALKESGKLNIYKYDSNNQLIGGIAQTIEYSEAQNYTSKNPLRFNEEVKKVVIEAYDLNTDSYFYINQIKEIDDEKLTSDFTYNDFSNLNYIYSYVKSEVKFATEGSSLSTLNTDQDYAYYEEPVSVMNFSVTPDAITNQEAKNIKMTLSTEASYYNENEEKWKNGIFVIELPEEILSAEINSVEIDNQNVEITSYETYEENGKQYIKIYTNNDTEETYKIIIDTDVTADPRQPTITKTIKVYAINQNCNNYKSTSRIQDVLDINGNKNVSENVLYKTSSIQMIAPTSLLTSQTLSGFDDKGTEVVSPQIAILDKSDNSRESQVNQTLTNNYSGTISEVKVIGKIPFKGNTYQINGKELGSTYSTTMKQGGISLPDSVKNIAKVYYSTNEIVNSTIADTTNNWKTAEEVTDWSSIKTYLIDLSDYTIAVKESLTFSYKIEIPSNIKYNDVAYSTHAVEFCLDTEDGKLKSKTEVNRLGIMIAKKYNVSLTKYKNGAETKVQGATYKVTDGTATRTGVTDENGNITISGLYVDKEYTLSEIQTPDSYILNEEVIKFKLTIDDEGNPVINIISGTLRDTATISNDNGNYTLNLSVEDIAKYDVKLTKTNGETGEVLKGVKYRLTGGIYGTNGRIFTTNASGEISIINLVPGTSYTLQETKADGYYVNDDIHTFSVSRNSSGKLEIISDFENVNIIEENGVDKAVVNVGFTNEAIPTYSLYINKKDNKAEALKGTQFKITSTDTGEVNYITTNENGVATLEGLYQYVQGKYITGKYVIQEVLATEGYITDKTEVKFKAESIDGILNISILEGEGAVVSSSSDSNTITLNFENKPIFNLTKKGDNEELLPNAVFKVTDLNGNYVTDVNGNIIGELANSDSGDYYVLTTDENGKITANLPEGLYKLVEVEAPEGYALAENEEDRTYYVGIGESRAEETEFKTMWAKSLSGSEFTNINDIKATTDGGYVIAGSFEGECDLNNDKTITSKGDLDALIVKYDKDGILEWYTNYGSYGADEFYSISLTTDGGYVVSGYEYTDNYEDGLVMKLDSSGNQVWKNSIVGELKDEIRDAEVLSTGNIAVVGRFYSPSITLADGVTISNSGNYDGFVACYGADGTYKWSNAISGTNNVDVSSITETSQGIVVSANFLGEISVGGNNVTSVGYQDAILVSYSLTGGYQRHAQIGGKNDESIEELTTDTEDNIVAVGSYASNFTLGTDSLTVSSTNYASALAVKYSSIGEYISNYNFGGTVAYDDKLTSVVATKDGGILLGGWFYSSIDIDGDGTNDYTSNGTSYGDGIIIKLNDAEEVEWSRNVTGSSYKAVYGIAELEDEGIVAVGNFNSSTISCEKESLDLTLDGYNDSFMIKLGDVVTVAEIPELQELEVENELQTFKVTTEIGENSDKERAGGTITGESTSEENIKLVETVKYGYDSTSQIIITPDEDYSIYEIKVNGEEYLFTPDENGIVTIPVFENVKENYHVQVVFEKNLSNIIVHHYLKDRDGNYTTTSVAEDEYLTDKIGKSYITSPKIDIAGYELEKDDTDNYVVPKNSAGTYTDEQIVVTYYYEEMPLTLTVHHYLEGTENSLVNDEIYSIYKGEEYATSADSTLLESYDLVKELTTVNPETEGTSGTLNENTEVIYYYKLKEYSITTKVNPITISVLNENTNEMEDVTVDGGTISGENQEPYEKVIHGSDSTKEIIVTPDKNFTVKSITVNGKNIEFTTNEDKTVTLSKFIDITEDKEVVVEFEKNIGNVIVHHYIEGTTTKVPLSDGTVAEDEEKKDYVGNLYATKAKDNISSGYELVLTPSNSSGTYAEEPIEVTYYYGLKEFNYTVHYFYDGIEDTSKTETVKATYQDVISTYTDKNITGYRFEKAENLPLTVSEKAENNTINVYYIIDDGNTKTLSYTVEYYKDGKVVSGDTQTETNTVQILQPDTLTVNKDKINTSNKYVGYKLAKIEVNTEEKDIPSTVNNGDVIKVYYVKNTSVIVKYLEKGNTDNLVLADEEIIEGYIGKDYTTEQKEIENYTFVESTNNTSGTMTETPITVIYYYLQNTKVIVNHIDKNSGEMLKTITEEGKVGDEYTSKSDNFEGYVLVESPENTTVTMEKDTITLNYYYVKVSEGVIEKHVNIITGEILYNELHEGNEGTSYETTSKEFESYQMITNKMYYSIDENLLVELEKYTEEEQEELKEAYEVSTLEEIIANYKEEILDKVLKDKELNAKDSYIPENHEGIMKPELIEVIYYYIRPASVKTMYVDIVTGNELETPDYKYGYEGDEYETQEKEIQGYELVEEKYPTNSKGTMEVTVSEDGVITPETTVTYYYVHNAKVVEKHINVKTNELIEETTYEGSEGDSYKTTSKEFEGYDLVESKLPESAEGTMTVDEIEVNYYYIRKTNVVVEYIDKNTGKNLLEKVEDSSEDEKIYTEVDSTEYIYGHEGDSYKTEEKKFESYVLVETSNNTEGTMETTVSEDGTIGITIYVKYYYAHPSSGVVEKPIDIMTGELIEKETIYEGYEGDSYKTTSKEFEGYDLVESKLPENAEGTMTLDEIEVKYYYIRKIKITVEYLEVGTDKKLAENEEINGHEGDSYIANSKDINGFTLVESPENATGTMGKTNIKVTYRYKANTAVENKENTTSTTTVINNTQTTIINNNTQQSSTQPATTNANTSTNSNTSKISTPSTGDIAPVVAVGTIFAVVILNLIQIKISNSKKSVNKKRKKHKIKGKRYK